MASVSCCHVVPANVFVLQSCFLCQNPRPLLLRPGFPAPHQFIRIRSGVAAIHYSLIPLAVQAVQPFLNANDDNTANLLAVLDSLEEYSVPSEDVVILCALSSIVSIRLRIVNSLVKRKSEFVEGKADSDSVRFLF